VNRIKTILVPVDASEYSLPAVQYARNFAIAIRAKLLLVTVINQRDIDAIKEALLSHDEALCKQIVSEKIADRRGWLDWLVQRADIQEITREAIVRQGVPHEELLKIIESAKPDLMVMGTKGRSSLADAIVGSCAQKMFRRCPIPLLSLRLEKPAASPKQRLK